MNPVPPEEAQEFGAAAAKAFAAIGGVDAARRAEDDPAVRAGEVAGALDALAAGELDPRAGPEALAAAAALCEAAGRCALPYPVPATLLADGEGRPFAVVPDGVARVDHGDLFPEWRVARPGRPAAVARPAGTRLGTRLGPFVTDLAEGGPAGDAGGDDALHLVLTGCAVLGTADRALALAVEHVTGRIQFGKPIAAFQSVQFTLADAAVAVAGLRELTHFTLWRLADAPAEAWPDVLALRVHALDVGRSVLRTAQQLHGAAGVCDEYDISVLTRMVQPALRLPWGAERTAAELAGAIRRDGFAGLFEHRPVAG
ncbi:MAG TPA: acyl-CoA dehydrogenase family protein [Acidimicrobiales bacterium]